ncbi:hypothetical protein [Streptomyces sp. NPDC056361]|uniref:hypothetical protein n=1 Tax=Streptomyces sp. NPDC056361 TaxID=3345795 RepID=UPI0035D8A36E
MDDRQRDMEAEWPPARMGLLCPRIVSGVPLMRRLPVVFSLATAVVTAAAISGCSTSPSASEQDASWEVKVGVCASDGPYELEGQQFQSPSCAITVDNRAGSMRAYTIDLTCTTAKRGTPFAAGFALYYVPAGQHTIASNGIAMSGTDQSMSCRLGSATVRDLTSDEGSPEPARSPAGALADAVATVSPDPEDTAAEATASARAEASQSAAAAASASASADLAAARRRALDHTYVLGDYAVNLTSVAPSGYDIDDQHMYIAGTVTSHSSDTGRMKQFGLIVTLLHADGSVGTSGTLCVQVMGGMSEMVETTTDGGTPDWTSIRITRSPTTPC